MEMTLTDEQYAAFQKLSNKEQLQWLEEQGELKVSDFSVEDHEETSSFNVSE
jgi:hypothetical protein